MIHIQKDQRGFFFKRGDYVKFLKPGSYFSPLFANRSFSRYQVVIVDVNEPFSLPDHPLHLFLHDEELLQELTILDVQDHELALHYEDGKFVNVYPSGKYAFWNVYKKHTFTMVDKREPAVEEEIDRTIFNQTELRGYFQIQHIPKQHRGLLFYNHQFQKEVKPGNYYFWYSAIAVNMETIDMRRQQLDIAGQEMMTADKVTLRLNFVCQYQVTDPLKVLEINNFKEQVYIHLQLVLREYIGTYRLDELLKQKQEIGSLVLERLKEKEAEFGVRFIDAGVKDIILPGDVKEIINTVLIAEKKAQANLITRREETASTRSLLNTAKLMDQNETLYRLKELEFMERICEKIGDISITGGGNLLEQLNDLLVRRAGEK
ncbi:slipin family protein [Desmospora activa]|uniref:SPFH domain/Band 7 family protein n=1 Tax=Desmospora activa DSM 45169 TaxID=1121389 RepID=A0A2T4Z0M5_9BACL|nr:slipin family protein [Desmospora activa]PTM53275.1 SPFH domain/Band 7 family protein [Desmospora activa DSM 45169]